MSWASPSASPAWAAPSLVSASSLPANPKVFFKLFPIFDRSRPKRYPLGYVQKQKQASYQLLEAKKRNDTFLLASFPEAGARRKLPPAGRCSRGDCLHNPTALGKIPRSSLKSPPASTGVKPIPLASQQTHLKDCLELALLGSWTVTEITQHLSSSHKLLRAIKKKKSFLLLFSVVFSPINICVSGAREHEWLWFLWFAVYSLLTATVPEHVIPANPNSDKQGPRHSLPSPKVPVGSPGNESYEREVDMMKLLPKVPWFIHSSKLPCSY